MTAAAGVAIEYREVSYTYPHALFGGGARSPALERVSLTVMEGERLGVLGPNGGGKSTLLKLTLGLLAPERGTIRVFGRAPREASRAGLVGFVPQRVTAELAFPLSVRQVVGLSAGVGVRPWRGLPMEARRRVEEAMEVVGVSELGERPIGRLSGGQVQRVMIARAIAGSARALLLDEPTVGIDVAGQQRFASLVSSLRERLGLTMVIVSHDIRSIAASCDRVACLSRTLHSHVAASGLTPQVLAEVFQHDVAAVFGEVHVDAHLASECAHEEHHEHHAQHEHGAAHDHGPRGGPGGAG